MKTEVMPFQTFNNIPDAELWFLQKVGADNPVLFPAMLCYAEDLVEIPIRHNYER